MKISTKGRYALRLMVDMAENNGNLSFLKDIAERQDISLKYLEQIASMLCKNNLIEGYRGPSGGYKLSKSPEEITIAQILSATEGNIAIVECLENGKNCERREKCKTKSCWNKLNNIITTYLDSVTLQDLL